MQTGIAGYGVYAPMNRITVDEIAGVWGEDGVSKSRGLNVFEKSVPDPDEDTITISVEAARIAMKMSRLAREKIGAVYVGSESHPFAVYPSAVHVAEALGVTPHVTAADLEFACKAGTAGMQMVFGLVAGNIIDAGIAIGADTSQGRPGDPLEYTAGAGGAAFVIGKDNLVAELEGTYSFTTDTPDFWRREGAMYPSHGSRFTGAPAYFRHVINAANGLMEKLGLTINDFDRASFHQPNGAFPLKAAKILGLPLEKIEDSLAVKYIGNTYSGASIVGFARQLDLAKPGERILLVSYGSGAGSDAFSFIVTDAIEDARKHGVPVDKMISRKRYINYATYARYRGKIRMK